MLLVIFERIMPALMLALCCMDIVIHLMGWHY